MEDSHGKEIDLQKTTIKIPGANRPRIGKSLAALTDTNRLNTDIANMLNLNANALGNSAGGGTAGGGGGIPLSSLQTPNANNCGEVNEPNAAATSGAPPPSGNEMVTVMAANRIDVNSKKRHRRIKSNHKSDQNKEDGLTI